MTNNILYISDGDYGSQTGRMLALVQGQYGQSVPIEVRDLADNVVNLTGYATITGHKVKEGEVTAWVGAIALSGTPSAAPQITLTVDEDDTGEGGSFAFYLQITNGSISYTTHPVTMPIINDPSVNATAAAGLVGVTTAQAALLAVIQGLTGLVEMAAGSATGVAIQSFMRTFLASATAIAARVNLLPSYTGNGTKVLAVNSGATDVEWVAQPDLATHAALTVTAHGGLVPQDAAILSKSSAYPLAAGDEAKIIECNGTFTITLPNGLDTGFQAVIVNIGTGVITLAATTTLTTKDSAVTLANQYGAATVYHAGSNVWRAFGDLS